MLEYRIGGLDISPETLRDLRRVDFIVGSESGTVFIYAKEFAGGHMAVAEAFGLGRYDNVSGKFITEKGKKVVGGGSITYFDGDLKLKHFSGTFGAIPREAAKRFGELLKPELEKDGIRVDRIMGDTNGEINPFWREYGFTDNK